MQKNKISQCLQGGRWKKLIKSNKTTEEEGKVYFRGNSRYIASGLLGRGEDVMRVVCTAIKQSIKHRVEFFILI